MLARLLWPLLMATSLLVPGVVSQSTTPSTADMLEVLPSCAVNCLIGVYGQGICSLQDPTCPCTSPEFQQAATICITSNCTVPEALFAKNVTTTGCGAPIHDRAPQHSTIVTAMFVLCTVAVIVRFTYRLLVAKANFGPDDWLILAAYVCAAVSMGVTEGGTIPNGLGKDIYTLSPTQITDFLFYFWIMAWIYFLQTTLIKLSIQFFFLRIFPSQLAQRMLWGTITFTALWGTAFVAGCLGQCTPVSFNWTRWDRLHEGQCFNITAFTWTHAVISIVIDFWMLALPLWQIKDLQMSLKKKVGVALMFSVGTFVTVISIVRLHSLVIFSHHSTNTTYDYFDVSIWSSIEVTVGIICACMPTIRQALAKLFPALMRGSSVGNTYGRRSRGKSGGGTHNGANAAGGNGDAGWRSKLSKGSRGGLGSEGSDPHHGYRLEGPNAGSTHVVVQGGHVALSGVETGPGRGMGKGGGGLRSPIGGGKGHFKDSSQIVVLQERSVRDMSDVELDSADGDATSRSSDRGDEATLVEMKDLSPKGQR